MDSEVFVLKKHRSGDERVPRKRSGEALRPGGERGPDSRSREPRPAQFKGPSRAPSGNSTPPRTSTTLSRRPELVRR